MLARDDKPWSSRLRVLASQCRALLFPSRRTTEQFASVSKIELIRELNATNPLIGLRLLLLSSSLGSGRSSRCGYGGRNGCGGRALWSLCGGFFEFLHLCSGLVGSLADLRFSNCWISRCWWAAILSLLSCFSLNSFMTASILTLAS